MFKRISPPRAGVAVWGSIGLAIVYFAMARLCVYLANTGENPAAIWVPSGIALAGLVYFGPRVWPGVFFGSLIANFAVDLSIIPAVVLALGNALDALVGTWGIRRVTCAKRVDFGRTRHVLAFIAYGAIVGPTISGGFGILGLHLAGLYESLPDALAAWVGWSLEDGLSVLIVSSALLLAVQSRHVWREPRKYAEAIALLACVAINAWVVLSRPHSDPMSQPYLVLPIMLWVVLRLGMAGAVLGNLVLTVLAGVSVVGGTGPFALDSLTDSMLWMQAFSSVVSLTTLLLAAALNQARSERYRQLFDGNQGIQLVLDAATGRIVDANPAACAFYSRPADVMCKLALRDLSADPSAEATISLARAVRENHGYFVRRHSAADNEVRDVELYCNPIQIDGRALIYAIVHDITARRQAEAALRQSEERLQLVGRATNDGVWDWDLRTNTMWHNDALRAVFGDGANLVGRTAVEKLILYIHPDDRDGVMTHLRQATARGDCTWSYEYRLRRTDETYAHVLARGYIQYEGKAAVRIIGVLLDLSERKRLEQELAHRATHDTLTGLANRSLIETTLATAILDGRPVALLIADLDRFKQINDTLGHHVGDEVLQVVAGRWRAAVRDGDLVGRLAGDEFALILPGADAEVGAAIAERLVSALEAPIVVNDQALYVGTSVGIATSPFDASDVESLLRAADRAMYLSKRAGGGFLRAAA